jgi:hypothetical protein
MVTSWICVQTMCFNSRESRLPASIRNVVQDLGRLLGLPSDIRTAGALIGDSGENEEQIR